MVSPAAKNLGSRQITRGTGLADEVYRRIRADIMSLRLEPDTKISVQDLVQEFRVSQTPIREALSMLEANGLVIKTHLVGYVTAPRMDRTQLDNLFEFRLLVEPNAARKAAQLMTEAELRKLSATLATPSASQDEFGDLDAEFHELIAQGSQNKLIAAALKRLHIHVHIFRSSFSNDITEEVIREHDAVIKAIISRNGKEAEVAMRRHLQSTYKRMRSFINE
jgi:DNA-binding GntR family transcriptional regulator